MAKRRPVRIEYTRVEHYSSGRPRARKQWSWWLIGAGVLAVVLFTKVPALSLLIGGIVFWYWRSQNGRRR